MKARLPIQAALMSLCLSLFATGKAEAYTFTTIADNSSLFSELFENPSINDRGTVAFRAQQEFYRGIFTGNGSDQIATIVRNDIDPVIVLGLKNSPAINNAGRVAFEAFTSTTIGEGVFTRNPGEPIATISIIGGSFKGDPTINDSGTVAATASVYPGGEVLIIGSGEPRPTVIRTASPLFSSFGSSTSINNQETVAFTAVLDSASFLLGLTPGNQALFTTSDRGNSFNLIFDNSGPFSNFGDLSLNEEGTTAFVADLDVGGQGIFAINTNTSPGLFGTIFSVPSGIPTFIPGQDIGGASLLNSGIISTIADTSGLFSNFDALSFNDQGIAAFLASLDTGGQGIFTGPDPITNKIIAIGDPLFGSTVTRLGFSQTGLNNLGQIAFYAELANGTRGIFRANPDVVAKPVPESNSAWGLLAIGGFGAVSVLKRKPKKTLNSAS